MVEIFGEKQPKEAEKSPKNRFFAKKQPKNCQKEVFGEKQPKEAEKSPKN